MNTNYSATTDALQTLDALLKFNEFVIIGHMGPDGDCLSSQLAISSFLGRMGKKTYLLSPGPFDRPEIADWKGFFSEKWPTQLGANAAAIIVDCSTIERISIFADKARQLPIIIVDHHSSGQIFGNYKYIDPSYPCSALMVYNLIRLAGEMPTKEEAEYLYFGFSTDTGFYRHLEPGCGRFLKMAAELTDFGASPKTAYQKMYGNRSLASRKLLALALGRMEIYCANQFIFTYINIDDKNKHGESRLDSDALYGLLQGISGAEAAALAVEEEGGMVNMGFRSLSKIDVGKVAADLGGGGHARASGCLLKASLDEARAITLKSIIPLLG